MSGAAPTSEVSLDAADAACQQHFVLEVRSEEDLHRVERVCAKWHLARYSMKWDLDVRSKVQGIGHVQFFYGVSVMLPAHPLFRAHVVAFPLDVSAGLPSIYARHLVC